ncbi:MAG: response regulator [Candidatus Roizmanbacteria bacterium]|nr:response regulator [Candidatus Roizmanbacteria bacterium]
MKKILIVEDELAYLKLLNAQLTERGYEVIEAINGKKGLEKAKSENPDLILLDIRMPVMDGMAMLNQLRKEEVGKKTQIIVLTNLEPDDKIIAEIVSSKPSYYFVKSDIQFDELLDKIKELLAEE